MVKGKEVGFMLLPEVQLVAERTRNLYGGPYRDRPRTLDALLLKLTKALSAKSNADLQPEESWGGRARRLDSGSFSRKFESVGFDGPKKRFKI
jgi:hypothetical protein